MLALVLRTRFACPEVGRIGPLVDVSPCCEHQRPGGMRLGPDRRPALLAQRLERLCVSSVDVERLLLVRPGPDPLQLQTRLGEPHPEMGDEILDRPVMVAVVAGALALR